MKSHGLPQLKANNRQGIRESRQQLVVPCGLSDGQLSLRNRPICQQSHEREQPQQARRGAGNGLVGPLALRLDAQRECIILYVMVSLPPFTHSIIHS
jgi:hypothetical protein